MLENVFILILSILILIIILITFIMTNKKCNTKEPFLPLLKNNKKGFDVGAKILRTNVNSTITVQQTLSSSTNSPFVNFVPNHTIQEMNDTIKTNLKTLENSYGNTAVSEIPTSIDAILMNEAYTKSQSKEDKSELSERKTTIASSKVYIDKLRFNDFSDDTKLSIVDMFYPIGSIYITVKQGYTTTSKPFEVGGWALLDYGVYLCNTDMTEQTKAYYPDSYIDPAHGASIKISKNTMPPHVHSLKEQITAPTATGSTMVHEHTLVLPEAWKSIMEQKKHPDGSVYYESKIVDNDYFNYYKNSEPGHNYFYKQPDPTQGGQLSYNSTSTDKGMISSYRHLSRQTKCGGIFSSSEFETRIDKLNMDYDKNLLPISPVPTHDEIAKRCWKTTLDGEHKHKLLYSEQGFNKNNKPVGGSPDSGYLTSDTSYDACKTGDDETTQVTSADQELFVPPYLCVCIWKRYS